MLRRLGIDSEFRGGLRVTTPEVRDVVQMVLTGTVQRELVGLLNADRPYAVGLSGGDGGLMTAQLRHAWVEGEELDVGLVGDVASINPGAVEDLLRTGRIPVISTVAPDASGEILNLNADTAAAALAQALGAQKLVILTDVAGLYASWPDTDSLINWIWVSELEKMLPSLDAGMVPKMEACVRAVRGGVAKAHVIDGRQPHSMLLEIFTDEGVGTSVLQDGASE